LVVPEVPFDHKYVPPDGVPVAERVVEEPLQIVWSCAIATVGIGLTVTVAVAVEDAQPPI